jgi:hypothetical protein
MSGSASGQPQISSTDKTQAPVDKTKAQAWREIQQHKTDAHSPTIRSIRVSVTGWCSSRTPVMLLNDPLNTWFTDSEAGRTRC